MLLHSNTERPVLQMTELKLREGSHVAQGQQLVRGETGAHIQ